MLTMEQCIELMAGAMVATSSGQTELPLRWGLKAPKGLMGMMPGYLSDPACFGIKIVNMMPGNLGKRSSHLGAMLLCDADTGVPLALINGGEVTAMRTAAASALATRLLARENANTLTIVGTGEQARSHLEAMRLVRDIREVRICSRSLERAKQFIAESGSEDISFLAFDDINQALEGADIVCTVTNASESFLFGEQLVAGMHVNLVGASSPHLREADVSVVQKSRYFVDYRPSAKAQASELMAVLEGGADEASVIEAEIGEVVSGVAQGRNSEDDITVYRSLGIVAQDLAVAWYLYERARDEGIAEIEF